MEQPLQIWLGTGGSPASLVRTAEIGPPMFFGILGAMLEHWARYGHAYREARAQASHPAGTAVAVHGFVAEDDRQAKTIYLAHGSRMFWGGSMGLFAADYLLAQQQLAVPLGAMHRGRP
jgi:alkanesulfonate monooxygenase SsuD/methylene tetrahydromethanopterin reductase-like flavin-dependent oxidoreductase (luciferase family)